MKNSQSSRTTHEYWTNLGSSGESGCGALAPMPLGSCGSSGLPPFDVTPPDPGSLFPVARFSSPGAHEGTEEKTATAASAAVKVPRRRAPRTRAHMERRTTMKAV